MGFDDAQNHLNCNRGVHGGSATAQHLQSGLDRQGMRRRHHHLRSRQADLRPKCCQRDEHSGKQAADDHARRATMNNRRNGNSVMPSDRIG